MRIGIFGGTFDPPHLGHLALAEAALTSLSLDEVIFLPANRNPLKERRDVTLGDRRLDMVRLLIRGRNGLAASDMEITRGGMSYTVDTLGELQMVQPAEYWFLLGADAVSGLSQWKNPIRLARLCRLGVALRPPYQAEDILARVPEEFKDRVDFIPMAPSETSSSDIRNRILESRPVTNLLTPEVLRYIQENRIYSGK